MERADPGDRRYGQHHDHDLRPVGPSSSVTDPLGRTTTYQYDNLGRKTAEIDPAALTTLTTAPRR